jgi:hypothetical protein
MTHQNTEQSEQPEVGAEAGARDNAAENVAPEVADDVLGIGAEDDVTDEDRGLEGSAPDDDATPGDVSRTGAHTLVDAEDLVHARGQDVTEVTLAQARADLAADRAAAIRSALPPEPNIDDDASRAG